MGQGTSTPPTAAPATPAIPDASNPNGSGLSQQQMQAVAALLGQMGKRPQMATAMQGMPQQVQPTQTIRGGTYFNPNKQ